MRPVSPPPMGDHNVKPVRTPDPALQIDGMAHLPHEVLHHRGRQASRLDAAPQVAANRARHP